MPTGTARARPRPRERIIDAALLLVSEGGYDAIQVRSLAEHADVSSRTIYEHFSSLDLLVIAAITEQLQVRYREFPRSLTGATASDRIRELIADLTATVTANRPITVALLRALLSGKPDVAPYVGAFSETLETMFVAAIAPNGPTERDRGSAKMLHGVWFSALVSWATGSGSDVDISDSMHEAVTLLQL